jgi:hypothetical protein
MISAPSLLTASTTPKATLTSGCGANQLVVVAVRTGNSPTYAGTPFADSKLNTWQSNSFVTFSSYGIRLFWSVLTTALVAGDQIWPTFTSSQSAVVMASCAPDGNGTGTDLNGTNIGSLTPTQTFASASGNLGSNQYAYTALSVDRNGPPSSSPTPAGWTLEDDFNGGGGVYFRFYYFLVGSSQTLNFTSTTSGNTNWVMAYHDYTTASTVYPASGSGHGSLPLLGVGE